MRKTNKYLKSSVFFVRLIWLGLVCQWLNCDWLGWSDPGILHLPNQARWEESNKQKMFSLVKHETYQSTISVPHKLSRKWARIGCPDLETVTGAISSSSLAEKSSPESVYYSSATWRSSSNCDLWRILTFACSMNEFIYDQPTQLKSDV